METLKKQTNVRGDVKVTGKSSGDVKETDRYSWRRGKTWRRKETDKSIGGDVKETDKYWWRR